MHNVEVRFLQFYKLTGVVVSVQSVVSECVYALVCGMNVHKRCEKNVANNCGINTKDMAAVLNQLGISGDKLNPSKRKKVGVVLSCFCALSIHLFMIFYRHY